MILALKLVEGICKHLKTVLLFLWKRMLRLIYLKMFLYIFHSLQLCKMNGKSNFLSGKLLGNHSNNFNSFEFRARTHILCASGFLCIIPALR